VSIYCTDWEGTPNSGGKAKGKNQKAKISCCGASPYYLVDEKANGVTDPQLLPFGFCLYLGFVP
jgi:hypothetical protein